MMDYAMASDVGRHRDHNEDRVGAAPLPDGLLGVVADGMGGHAAGEVASQMAMDALLAAAGPAAEGESLLGALEAAALAAHAAIQAAAQDGREGMGCTLTAAAVRPGRIELLHIGDSRAYVIGEAGMRQITTDDTLVQEMVSERVLTAEQARSHPARSVLTQALGVGERPTFLQIEEPVADGVLLLLCSDGLTAHLSDEKIARQIELSRSLGSAARRLVEAANRAGGRDNISVLLVRCGPQGT